jgi:hypothetical protein
MSTDELSGENPNKTRPFSLEAAVQFEKEQSPDSTRRFSREALEEQQEQQEQAKALQKMILRGDTKGAFQKIITEAKATYSQNILPKSIDLLFNHEYIGNLAAQIAAMQSEEQPRNLRGIRDLANQIEKEINFGILTYIEQTNNSAEHSGHILIMRRMIKIAERTLGTKITPEELNVLIHAAESLLKGISLESAVGDATFSNGTLMSTVLLPHLVEITRVSSEKKQDSPRTQVPQGHLPRGPEQQGQYTPREPDPRQFARVYNRDDWGLPNQEHPPENSNNRAQTELNIKFNPNLGETKLLNLLIQTIKENTGRTALPAQEIQKLITIAQHRSSGQTLERACGNLTLQDGSRIIEVLPQSRTSKKKKTFFQRLFT